MYYCTINNMITFSSSHYSRYFKMYFLTHFTSPIIIHFLCAIPAGPALPPGSLGLKVFGGCRVRVPAPPHINISQLVCSSQKVQCEPAALELLNTAASVPQLHRYTHSAPPLHYTATCTVSIASIGICSTVLSAELLLDLF